VISLEAEGECGLGGEGKVSDPNARVQAQLFTSLKNVQSRALGVSGGYYYYGYSAFFFWTMKSACFLVALSVTVSEPPLTPSQVLQPGGEGKWGERRGV